MTGDSRRAHKSGPVQPGDALAAWCAEAFGVEPAETLFQAGHLSRVVGYRLANGAEVVLKLRPTAERLLSCLDVQLFLWRSGYPCPQPLVGPAFLGGQIVTGEAFVPPGEKLDGPQAAPKFAEALARLVTLTAGFQLRLSLEPSPPWLGGWQHDGLGLWPPADDLPDDLNAIDTPWLDSLARGAAAVLRSQMLPNVIGHADWWPDNIEWRNEELYVVHDWDSLAYLPEAVLAGGAAVLYAYSPEPTSTLTQSEAFLAAYEAASGRRFSEDERRVAWAAGLWNLAFDAKKDIVRGGGATVDGLRKDGDERLRRASA